MPSSLDRFRGCVVGCAVGDALAMPVEGLAPQDVAERFGGCVRDYHRSDALGPGQYTDDTQMTVLLAESIVHTGCLDVQDFASRLGEWILGGDSGESRVRRVGRTTAAAARRLAEGVDWTKAGEPGGGCEAAVRAAPVGLLHAFLRTRLLADARLSAVCTHTDKAAIGGALAVAAGTAELALAASPLTPAHFINVVASAAAEESSELAEAIIGVKDLLETPEGRMPEWAGTGAEVRDVVPAAVCCFLRHPRSFERAVERAAAAAGACCSVAAITGAWAGAHLGLARIPSRLLNGIENLEGLVGLGEGVYRVATSRGREVSRV